MTAQAWPATGTIGARRVNGKTFVNQEPGQLAGFYYFPTPDAAYPLGPFKTAAKAEQYRTEGTTK